MSAAPEAGIEARLLELKSGLVRACSTDYHELLGGRHSDGTLPEPAVDTAAAFTAALHTLAVENDVMGSRIAWETSFRIRKRKAQEAAGLRQPLKEGAHSVFP